MSKRLALLIGNTKFDDAENFCALRTPAHDVHDFAIVLQEYGDFEIVNILLDENAETIAYAIEEFYHQTQRGDLSLLYYSGHGYKDVHGNLYFVAKNTQARRPLSTGIREAFIQDVMRQSQSRHQVIILDCCFSGAFITGQKRGDEPLLLEKLQGEATAILASSGKIQYSFEEPGHNSLFTYHLLKGIETGQADENKDGKILIEELFNYTEGHVRGTRPEQTPMLRLDQRASEIVIAKGLDSSLGKVFICYASPEDNYFATWLASKLSLCGYEVWCDNVSKGDEDYRQNIEQVVGRDVIRFLFVTTHKSIQKDDTLEKLAAADKMTGKGNFIIPVRIEDIPLGNLPPEITGLNTIDFSQNWAVGLRELVDKLDKDDIPKPKIDPPEKVLDLWRKNLSIKENTLIDREENYWSNWFEFTLPRYLYLHMFAAPVSNPLNFPYPAFQDKSYLLSFACQECFRDCVVIAQTEKIDVETFLASREYEAPETKFLIKDTNKKIVRLLNEAFCQFLINRGLKKYNLSKGEIFYFSKATTGASSNLRISLKRYGRRDIQLAGTFKGFNWHFAVEGQAFLHPTSAYFITYHVVFTENGPPLGNKRKQHSLRRKLGKDWYNKKWRDLTLGSMLWLSEKETDQSFKIPVDCEQFIEVKNCPLKFRSPIGYTEPTETADE